MKCFRTIITLIGLLAFPLASSAQIKAVAKASAGGPVTVTPIAGDYLVVFCNSPSGVASDNSGNAYKALGALTAGGYSETAWLASNVPDRSTTVICPNSNEVYVVDVLGAASVDAAANFTGTASPTSGSVTTSSPGDLVLGYCQSGSCLNATGWTSLSTLDSNLVASITPATPGLVKPTFRPSSDYTETLLVFHLAPAVAPQPLQIALSGCCTVTFPIVSAAQIPTCAAADGACSITIQVCDLLGNCLTSNGGTISLVKTSTLPTPQTLTVPVATANP